ncbi:MAG: diaminopimelate decarboxylase family protein [Deltaproteobacteria bacterium]
MPKSLSYFKGLISKVLGNKASPLPPGLLRSYVNPFLSKREILLESASRFGTPQYFFDEPALEKSLSTFHEIFSRHLDRFRIFYAVKSNSFPWLSKHVSDAGHGLDVSSGVELGMAVSLGCSNILFSGPAKTEAELSLAIQNRDKVTLLMDSATELERVAGLVKESDLGEAPLRLGVRLRGQHHGIWGKFGIPPERFPELFTRALNVNRLDPCGIQFHTSWNMGPEAQVKMIERIGACVKALPEGSQRRLKFLDIGGGYWPERGEWLNAQNTVWGKVLQILDPDFEFEPRHYCHPSRPLEDFAREISAALRRQGKPLSDLEIFMEPGRWISTPALHVLVKVVDKKEATVAIADGGINLLGWERPLFEFIPILNLTRPSVREFPVRVFGNLCTPLDVWGTTLFGEGVENGDILLLPDQGSYTYSLRQSFIMPIARVVPFDGTSLSEAQPEQTF